MGTLRYKVVKRRNPMTAAVSYGPRLLRYTLIKADDVVERAAQNSNIDRGLLEAAMVGFQEAVRNFIMNGHNLQLFPLGSFCVSLLSTEGTDTPEAVSARQIKGAHLWFRSSPTLNGYKARQNIRLVRIGEEEAEGGGEEEEGAHELGPPHGGPDARQRIALCFCSFYHPPGGSVDSSVLFYFGQTLLYAGSVFGVKLLMSEEIRRHLGPGPPDAKAGKP